MSIQELITSISDRIQTTASVKAVYGDPVTVEGKTIIPIARVRYGFGGGGGTQDLGFDSEAADTPQQNVGGGGGGGVEVSPVGFIEITLDETRYASFEERRRIIRALLIGLLLGAFFLRRRLSR